MVPYAELVFEAILAAWSDAAVPLVRRAEEERPADAVRFPGTVKLAGDDPVGMVDDGGEFTFFPQIREAFNFLRDRSVLPYAEYKELVDAARKKAFSVAGVESQRALDRVSDLLQESIRDGWSNSRFREEVDRSFSELGLTGLTEHQATRVFRTNVAAARAEAHDRVLADPFVGDAFPFDRYDAIDDARSDPTHVVLDNWVFLRGDPVWYEGDPPMRPPRRPNCRCDRTAISVAQFLVLYRSGAVRYGSRDLTLRDPQTGKPVRIRRDAKTELVLRKAKVR
jgi:hypothetical protein